MKIESLGPQTPERETRKAKTPSSAASIVAQTKKKMEQEGKVGSIAGTRAEHSMDARTGEPVLAAVFPRQGGREPHYVDLSFLLAFPNLQPMFVDAFLCWGATVSPQTRLNCRDYLRRYFFAYVKSNWSDFIHPVDIDDEMLAGFRDKLLNESGQRVKALHPHSVRTAMGVLRSTLGALNTGQWASVANRIAERIHSGSVGVARKTVPTRVLGLEQLLAILGAAEREVLAIEQRFANARVLMADGRARLHDTARIMNNTRSDYRNFSVCLAAVDEAYPELVPDVAVIKQRNPALGRAITHIHGQAVVTSHFYPSGRDLVPFVLLLTVATVFNPDTILSLNWRDIDFNKDQAGTPVIEIVGVKGRAVRDLARALYQDATVSSRLSLKQLLVCLREITTRIRAHLAPEHTDRLFVYVQQFGVKRPKGFGEDGERRCMTGSNDRVWGLGLMNFIKDNKLPPFTLGQLRPSILDMVQFMDGSLEAARKVGNHGSPATTWTHYTSGGVRARYRERIGQVIVMRERWLQTSGVIDPRRLAPGQDKGAATPGFSCLDPFDSPRPNQQPGKLCKDYGGCPSCANAAAHPGDPVNVAYYTALEVAIYRSQGAMSARTWIERWTPILADLAALRAWISSDVLEASREISIRLPNVG
ncbi:MAG: hypothetical protein V4582_16630 [Pseudomonadota bacterium]